MPRNQSATDLDDLNSPAALVAAASGPGARVLDLTTDATDADAIARAAADLAAGDRLVVSLANPAHGSLRLAGLQGRAPAAGLTLDALCAVLEGAGLGVESIGATLADPLAVPLDQHLSGGLDDGGLPAEVVEWVRDQPHALEHTYVVTARRLAEGEQAPARPLVQPAAPSASVRRTDHHTEAVEAAREVQHRLLNQREHIIGLEASLATQDFRTADAYVRAKNAEARYRQLKKEQDAAAADPGPAEEPPAPLRKLVGRRRPAGPGGSPE